jgi:hypothetical protein
MGNNRVLIFIYLKYKAKKSKIYRKLTMPKQAFIKLVKYYISCVMGSTYNSRIFLTKEFHEQAKKSGGVNFGWIGFHARR